MQRTRGISVMAVLLFGLVPALATGGSADALRPDEREVVNGYLLTFEATLAGCRRVAAAAIANYQPPRPLRADGAWRITLLDEQGGALWQSAIAGPLRTDEAAGIATPFIAKAPVIAGARQLVVEDAAGARVLSEPIDERFEAEAREARRHVLALLRDNERLVGERAAHRPSARWSLAVYGSPDRFAIDEELERLLGSELAGDHEVLEEWGGEVAELYRTLGQRPGDLARQLAGDSTREARWQGGTGEAATTAEYCALSGTVRTDAGALLPGTTIRATGRGVNTIVTTNWSGNFVLTVPKGVALTLVVDPPPPYGRALPEPELTLGGDMVKHFVVERGHVVSGRTLAPSGASLGSVGMLVRHVNALTLSQRDWSMSGYSSASGEFSFVVPRWLQPAQLVLSFAHESYLRRLLAVTITGDTTFDVTLQAGTTISGVVRDGAGAPVSGVRVRAYQTGQLAGSNRSLSDGSYSIALAPGNYDLVASVDTGGIASRTRWAPQEVKGITVGSVPLTLDFALAAPTGVLELKLYLADSAATLFGGLRCEVSRAGRRIAGGYPASQVLYDVVRESSFANAKLYLEPGRYDIELRSIGYAPVTLQDVDVGTSSSVTIQLPTPLTWNGVLRDPDGTPIAGTSIVTYDDLTLGTKTFVVSAAGNFSIPITPGGFLKVFAPEQGDSILQTQRLPDALASRSEDLTLDRLVTSSGTSGVLAQLCGVPDRINRFNLVYIAESFTNVQESFTDTNHNGMWDAVLFNDYDQNGVWTSGEPYTLYGNAKAPVTGHNPSAGNEPIADSNGDGYLSVDDLAVFDRNAIDTTRSLFGQDRWRLNRDLFNVFRIQIVSQQAGYDIITKDKATIQVRDTKFGATLSLTRNTLSANYALIAQMVNVYLPEADTIIAVINQPVYAGRANSFILTYGGPAPLLANSYVIAHEMGHNVGRLGDEYTEYDETLMSGENTSPNTTVFSQRDQIPWHNLIDPDRELPSIDPSAGIGLFEGARYYTSGAYRPTAHCMMVSGNRYCPICTRELEYRAASIRGDLTGIAVPLAPAGLVSSLRPTFSWRAVADASHYRLELRRVHDNASLGVFDIYGTSWTLPFDLEPGAYRWRLSAGVERDRAPWSGWLAFQTSGIRRHLPGA
jgi:hypothetical protein